MTAYPFTDRGDPTEVTLYMDEAPGVEHPGCIYRAEVIPELDCFYCRHCGRNGRISGAWFTDLLMASQAPTPGSEIADLTAQLAEAIELLRHPNEHDVAVFLKRVTP